MWKDTVTSRPSNAMDIVQPLLDPYNNNHQRVGHEVGMATTSPVLKKSQNVTTVPDTVDFGSTCSTSSNTTNSIIPTIDNTRLVYVPIRLSCGVQVNCAPEVLSCCPMVLRSIQTDLHQILKVLPWSTHALVKRTNIWVNASYAYGPRDDPKVLRHSTTHHEEGWLVHCARDRPEKARGIEIYSCYDFERMRLHWNGCGLLMHEFCHLIHQFCLGLHNVTIQDVYEQARLSKRYNHVLRRDWAGKDEDYDMAYAMVDYKEFFAEMSIAYLCQGYRDLDHANPNQMEDCSPPLLQPTVTDRVVRRYCRAATDTSDENYLPSPRSTSQEEELVFKPPFSFLSHLFPPKPEIRMVDPRFQEEAIARSCLDVTHCNKFYPFTRGQLKYYDPELFHKIEALWREIAMYDDPEEDDSCCRSLRKWLPQFR